MKLFARAIGILLLAACCGCAQRVLVQPVVDTQVYGRLAILPFESTSVFSTVGHQLADEIIVDLLQKAPQLDIVERTRIDAVLQEQNLGRQGYLSPETAVAVGRVLGVRAILTGSVSVSIGDIQPTPLSAQRVATGVATARLIDTQTGKIIWGVRENREYSTFSNQDYRYQVTGNIYTDQEMVQEVIKQLGSALAQAFYPHYELRY